MGDVQSRRAMATNLDENTGQTSKEHDAVTFLAKHSSSRELAKRGLRRQQEARERVVKKAVARGEMGLYVTDAMVRQEMSRQAVELMQGKVGYDLDCGRRLGAKLDIFRPATGPDRRPLTTA